MDPSGVDWLYDRHVIDAVVTLNPSLVSGYAKDVQQKTEAGQEWGRVFVSLPGLDAGEIHDAVRKLLMEPRKPLRVYNGANQSLEVPGLLDPATGQAANSDCNNGPLVQHCTVIRASGNQFFELNIVIVACTRDCPPEDRPPYAKALLSNRYSTTHDVDDRHFLTMRMEGVAIFRTDLIDLAQKNAKPDEEFPDFFRNKIIPPPADGFQRKSIRVSIVPSRNAISWAVVDREMPIYLGGKETNPWGVVDFQATLSSTFHKMEGVAIPRPQMTIQCRAVGNNTSSRWLLTKFCAALAYSKLQIGRYPPGEVIPNDIHIVQHLHERVVELSWTVSLPAIDKPGIFPNIHDAVLTDDSLPFLFERNGKCPNPPNDHATRGTYPYMAIASRIGTSVACGQILTPRKAKDLKFTGNGSVADLPTADGSSVRAVNTLATTEAAAVPEPISNARSTQTRVNGVDVRAEILTDLPTLGTNYRNLAHQYTQYTCFVKYEPHYGKLIMPISAGSAITPGSKRVAVIDTHTPYMTKVIRWEATRVGRWPEMPHPHTIASQSSYKDETLLSAPRTFGSPVKTPDGSQWVYSATGEYRYLMQRSFAVEGVNPFATSLVPWLAGKFSDCYVPNDAWVHYVTEDYPQSNHEPPGPKNFAEGSWPPKPGQWPKPPTADGRQ